VIVVPGETDRAAGLTVRPFWTAPSDQVTFQGEAPVSAAWMFVLAPAQIVAVPETVAVGTADAVIPFVDEALHPPIVTVTPSVIGPGAAALKLMFAVPAPELMVPFVSVQT
jgi:hypothetical protein